VRPERVNKWPNSLIATWWWKKHIDCHCDSTSSVSCVRVEKTRVELRKREKKNERNAHSHSKSDAKSCAVGGAHYVIITLIRSITLTACPQICVGVAFCDTWIIKAFKWQYFMFPLLIPFLTARGPPDVVRSAVVSGHSPGAFIYSPGNSVCWFIKNTRGRTRKQNTFWWLINTGVKNQPHTIGYVSNIHWTCRIIQTEDFIINRSFRLHIPYNWYTQHGNLKNIYMA
jgi:hypothetical protein